MGGGGKKNGVGIQLHRQKNEREDRGEEDTVKKECSNSNTLSKKSMKVRTD